MIEKLTIEDNGLPSSYLSLNLIVKGSNGEILLTNNHELFELFKLQYYKEFPSFNDFLNQVLNYDFVINQNLFGNKYFQKIEINKKIEKEFNNNGFNKFLKKYTIKSKSKYNDFELNKDKISSKEYLTVLYFFYIYNYDVSVDCYLGKDYLNKRERSFN